MADASIPDLSPEEVRKAKNREKAARYRARHPERLAEIHARSRTKHAAKRRAYNHTYYAQHTERERHRARTYRQQHPEKRHAIEQLYNAMHQEERRAYNKRRYWANPPGEQSRAQTWREAHPEHLRQYSRAWRRANRHITRMQGARRRARMANAPINDFTDVQWEALCKAAGSRCCYCGRTFPADALTPDHLTPYAKQGSNTLHNILPACGSCNSSKRDRAVLKPVQPFLLLPPEDAAAD